jgi:quinol monooxygenase YgiN
MIKHIVFFRFKPEVAEAEREEFLSMLRALPERISEVLSLEVGVDVVHSPRSFDAALVSTFADLQALDAYAKHPEHQPVLARARDICAQVAAVDYEA